MTRYEYVITSPDPEKLLVLAVLLRRIDGELVATGDIVAVDEHPLPGAEGHCGSIDPSGGATEAVFVSSPVVPAATVPTIAYDNVPPDGTVTVSPMSPVPCAVQLVPGLGVQVHDTPVRAEGIASTIETPVAVEGPVFETVTVYVI